ncbi:MAG: M48 family metallopeptidase [Chloroflexi bacterium]|nr:M48 family metallopeptidase [Chloroflexota bacterium]
MGGPVVETPAVTNLPGGRLDYTLRRNPRSRTLRVTIDPRRGLVVSIPPASRRGWARPEATVERFLRDRERWIRRHLARLERQRAEHAARGGLSDGATLRYRGLPHRLEIRAAGPTARRSTVTREGLDDGDALVVRLTARDRRGVATVLQEWFRARAAEAIDRAIEIHAAALRVDPARISLRDPRTRWGSASRDGALSFSWRLVLAPPEALETVVAHELAHLRVFGHGPRFWALVASRRPDHVEWRRWLRRHSHELHNALEDAPSR